MPYDILGDIEHGTPGEHAAMVNGNPCNILTLNNVCMLCDDIELNDYVAEEPIFTFSSGYFVPTGLLKLPCVLTENDVDSFVVLHVGEDGYIYLPDSYASAVLHTNGIMWNFNSTYYQPEIGNTQSSLWTSPVEGI